MRTPRTSAALARRTSLVAFIFLTVLGPLAPAAAPTPAGTDPGRDTPAAANDDCERGRSAERSPHDEFASCLAVSAELDRIPATGEEARLRVLVTAFGPTPGTQIAIDLPEAVGPARSVEGLSTRKAVNGAGPIVRATTSRDLAAGETVEIDVPIEARKAGFADIQVSASAPHARGDAGDTQHVFLDVSDEAGSSRQAPEAPAHDTSTRSLPVDGAPAAPRSTGDDEDPPPLPGSGLIIDQSPFADVRGVACVTGGWSFNDPDGVTRRARDVLIEVRDARSDRVIGRGFTGNDGRFEVCFVSHRRGRDVYYRAVLGNGAWRIRNTPRRDQTYAWVSQARTVCHECTHDFGWRGPGDSAEDRAVHAHQSLSDLYRFVPLSEEGGCWDANDTPERDCRQMIVNWTKTSTDGTYYSTSNKDIHLEASDPDYPHVVIHEAGHALMDDVYEDDYPPFPNCNPHFLFTTSSAGCAWTEGFATWLAVMALDDPVYVGGSTFSVDLEAATWDTNATWDRGDTVEGRVIGTMIDLADADQDEPWDTGNEGWRPQYDVFLNQRSETFEEFLLSDRRAMGHEASVTGPARSSAFQNTIDYDFRERVRPGEVLARPTMSGTPREHNYAVRNARSAWSIVAVGSAPNNEYHLRLYDDVGLTSLLTESTVEGQGEVDYVVVDSNHRALGNDFPQVVRPTILGGDYDVTFRGGASLPDGTHEVTMARDDVARVFDIAVQPGPTNGPVAFRVVPGTGVLPDPELYLHDSSEGSEASWVQSRSGAVASSNSNPWGEAEQITYLPSHADRMALVLVNRTSGRGTYTLYRDSTEPTGSLTINGGQDTTDSRRVTLILPAEDADTGVAEMRISTDGRLDTEEWVPYVPVVTRTLPPGDGLKTVRAQVRNNAGLTSRPMTDRITLETETLPENGLVAFRAGNDLFTMNPDGTDRTTLTDDGATIAERFPVWSPDSTQVAFVGTRAGSTELYVMDADGTDLRNLTNGAGAFGRPTWSPDGTELAVGSRRDGPYDVYVINADGTGMRNLTNGGVSYNPKWSPDGSEIAFQRDHAGGRDIFAIGVDGTGMRNLTNDPGARYWHPTWSPDGTEIAMTSDRDGGRDVFVMNADGTNVRNVTEDPDTNDQFPWWSPDGEQLLFISNRAGPLTVRIFAMDADGTNVRDLGPGTDPSWQPIQPGG